MRSDIPTLPRLLVLDAEPVMRALLAEGLGGYGFRVLGVGNAHDALRHAAEWAPEAIVLDPEGFAQSAVELLTRLTRITDVPRVVLSAAADSAAKVEALLAGADAYLTKPFSMAELGARLDGLLRRSRSESSYSVRYADLVLDIERHDVVCGNVPVALTLREFDLLLLLMRNPGRVVSRERILKQVWRTKPGVTEQIVDVYVHYLRRKLDRALGKPLIRTIHGIGYMLTA